MRKKAERKIRKSVLALGKSHLYRIDKVREGADLIKKVFDKTVLDMARVGTIELYEGDHSKMTDMELSNLIQKGDMIFSYFSFFESYEEIEANLLAEEALLPIHDSPPPAQPLIGQPPETVTVTITGIEKAEWEFFNLNCMAQEGKGGTEKLMEVIYHYNQSIR